jgi:hypothetical protein
MISLPNATPKMTPPSFPPGALPPQATNEIYIMAFICKRLPMCPNPDPALHW